MGFCLGVDLGTTFVAAARAEGTQVEMVALGDRSVVMPSTVFVAEDGSVVTGEAAERRAVSNPERVARQFKRRLGDPTPLRLGEASYSATDLLAVLLGEVLARVKRVEGEPPDQVVLTHPANWGPFRRGVFDEVPRTAGLSDVLTMAEPEAAALHYAATSRLDNDELIAVYDLGGGTFDATVVRKTPNGVVTLGTPEGVERLGGIDFDQALFDLINHRSNNALNELDMGDLKTVITLTRLRQDCVLAKESLSVDTETLVPVFLPGRHFDVRVTRADFEDLIRAQVESTITALTRALRSADVTADELNAVLLVGGSSRIPLVAQMVSEELQRPVLVDTHPKNAVALGAATSTNPPAAEYAAQPTTLRATTPPTTTPTGPRPRSVRSTLLLTGAAALLLIALTWTLITPSAPPSPAPPNTAAPTLPAVLPPPRQIVRPKADQLAVSATEPAFFVLNGSNLARLDLATLAPRWSISLPQPGPHQIRRFGGTSVGVCAGERTMMTECTPVNITTGTIEPAIQLPGNVFAIFPIDDGKRMLLLNQGGIVNVMDMQTREIRTGQVPRFEELDKKMSGTVGGHRAFIIRNIATPTPELTIIDMDTLAAATMPWPPTFGPNPGPGWLWLAAQDGTSLYAIIDQHLSRLDIATMRLQYRIPQPTAPLRALDLAPDGRYLYLASADGELRVVETATGLQVSSGRTRPNPTGIFSTDRGRLVAVATDDHFDLFDTSAFAGS